MDRKATREKRTYRSLEYIEEMRWVVRIQALADVAEVFGAIYTAEPLARDAIHTVIAQCSGMVKRGEVG